MVIRPKNKINSQAAAGKTTERRHSARAPHTAEDDVKRAGLSARTPATAGPTILTGAAEECNKGNGGGGPGRSHVIPHAAYKIVGTLHMERPNTAMEINRYVFDKSAAASAKETVNST